MYAAFGHTSPRSRQAQTESGTSIGRPSLILHIAPEGTHSYRARLFDGKEQVGSATCHDTLDGAIHWYGQSALLPGIEELRIWYGGWCAGSFKRARMGCEAQEIANRLLVLALVER